MIHQTVLWVGVAVLGLLASTPGIAAEGDLPPVKKLRFDEDYSSVGSMAHTHQWPGCWKHIQFQQADRYRSVGGEVRQRYEYTNNPGYGQAPQDKRGVWLQRFSLLGDLHWSRQLRFFGQLTSALETGRAQGPSPVDENKLEWQNAFVELGQSNNEGREGKLRLGRQEVVLGSGRLVDVREGPNVRRTFDGARGKFIQDNWRFDVLAARPRLDRLGVFDDMSNDTQGLWGIYSVRQRPSPATDNISDNLPGNIDIYFLGYENENATFVQGTAHEDRYSLGARFWGDLSNWRWNWEALYQYGHFGNANIEAWTVATETTYQWRDTRWQPALKLSVNIASGDDDPNDSELGTFNPLYPRGNYFSEAAVFGPRNFYNFHAFLYLQPTSSMALTADLNFFWRLETEDGIYSPSGQIFREPDDSTAHFVATAFSFTAEYTVSRELVFTAIQTFGKPEQFLRDTGPSKNLSFTELTMQYRF